VIVLVLHVVNVNENVKEKDHHEEICKSQQRQGGSRRRRRKREKEKGTARRRRSCMLQLTPHACMVNVALLDAILS
jgi:hypothetical protein